ncbi:hypothetical protein [Cellulosimicrobium arenosum]|uniref:DUF3137 domain-containing protein n=1 Tax=Cellulosimicrobium arenosum TaxID=2708133 RepID=A0A927G7J7_9MICO|nr:hypothetical protein [Cellulosimicrobium arenosum]MBD8078371.1 hypothetical protein [Cellulosimicrobium arenosum]
MTPEHVDLSVLDRRTTREEAVTVREMARRGAFGEPSAQSVGEGRRTAGLLGIVVGVFLGLICLVTLVVQLVGGSVDRGELVVWLVLTAVLVSPAFLLPLLGRASDLRMWRRCAPLLELARANGAQLEPVSSRPALPGRIFGVGIGRVPTTTERVAWPATEAGPEVETGTRTYVVSSSSSSTTHRHRYVAVRLDAAQGSPRIVFEPGRHDGIRQGYPPLASRSPDGTLYAGSESGDHAQRLFTDDLLGLLADRTGPMAAEVVDGWFLAWTVGDGSPTDQRLWRRQLAIVTTVLAAELAGR